MRTKTGYIAEAFAKREKQILTLRNKGWTLRKIAERVELSYERVRQILRDHKVVAK